MHILVVFLAVLAVALAKPQFHNARPVNNHGNNGNQFGHANNHQENSGIIGTYPGHDHNGECGSSVGFTSNTSTYIVGGKEAVAGQFPWQVILYNRQGSFICGGCLVWGSGQDEVKVITAAHCVQGSRYSVGFGILNRQNLGAGQVVSVSSFQAHESYNGNTLINDIAVLNFDGLSMNSLMTNTDAKPVCIPSKGYSDGEQSWVSGWGTTTEGGSTSSQKMFVEKELISPNTCRSSKYQYGNSIHDSMICAGEPGIDACQGDSGGPLVVKNGDRAELVGVVSWGYGCGRVGYPGVYANVYNLRTWLQNNGVRV